MSSFPNRSARSFSQQERIDYALRENESVEWVVRPAATAVGRGQRMAGMMGSLFAGWIVFYFVIRPDSPLRQAGHPDAISSWVAVGICLLVSMILVRVPWRHMKKLRNTLYLMTNQRVVVLYPHLNNRDESMPLSAIDRIEVSTRRKGSVLLHSRLPEGEHASRPGKSVPLPPLRLEYLAQPDAVAKRIKEAGRP